MDATKDHLHSRWYELKSQVRQTFPRLTAEDVEQLSGGMDDLAGMVQHRYGYTRSQADIDVNNWLRAIDKKSHPLPPRRA
jgi:uncharacterized protein YjbJ (UPF0337 family)